MLDWEQIGEDFKQKYEGTFCRYLSPVTNIKEVFCITMVTLNGDEAPSLTLFNKKHGEVYMSYTTEAELDFTFPRCGYFQHNDKALLFSRLHTRQWKKGICSGTAYIMFPYFGQWNPTMNDDTLSSAFKAGGIQSLSQGLQKFRDKDTFSVALSPTLAVGLAKKDEFWLWYENELIAEVEEGKVVVKTEQFRQEIQDHLRNTGDYATRIV